MTYQVKNGTYNRTEDRKRKSLERLIEEHGALHVMKILRNVFIYSKDRHQQIFLSKLSEAIEVAEDYDAKWSE